MNLIFIGIGVLALIILIVVVYFVFLRADESEPESEPESEAEESEVDESEAEESEAEESETEESEADESEAPIDCKLKWGKWENCRSSDTSCPKRMGAKFRKATVERERKFGGVACPSELTEYKFDEDTDIIGPHEHKPGDTYQTGDLPNDMFNQLKNEKYRTFQLVIIKNGEPQCVQIDMGGDDKFSHKDDIVLSTCDVNDDPQLWMFDHDQRYIKTVKLSKKNESLCLDYNDDKFKVTRCGDNPQSYRKFKILPATKWQVDGNGNPLWHASHARLNLRSTAIPVRIKADKSNKCMRNPSRHGQKRYRVTSCTFDDTKMYLIPHKLLLDPMCNGSSTQTCIDANGEQWCKDNCYAFGGTTPCDGPNTHAKAYDCYRAGNWHTCFEGPNPTCTNPIAKTWPDSLPVVDMYKKHPNSDNNTATFIKELPSTHTLEDVMFKCNQLTNCKQVVHAGRYYLKEGNGSITTPAARDSWSVYVKK